MAFQLYFTPKAWDHLKGFRKMDQQAIVDAAEEQLTHQPNVATRKRKRLAANRLAPWELRLGAFRVFYDVHEDDRVVVVLAVGRKQRNRLIIGGEEVEL